MVVADRMHKTLPELYATISSPVEILEWLTFYRLQRETPGERKERVASEDGDTLSAKIRNQFMMHNAGVKAREDKKNGRKDR